MVSSASAFRAGFAGAPARPRPTSPHSPARHPLPLQLRLRFASDRAHFLLYPPRIPGYCRRRRRGRVVEGTPLLRVQTGNRLEGSNPFVSATCTLRTRKQVPRGAFFSMCQRGLHGPPALRRLANRARSVSERPPSLSTRPSLSARRFQNLHAFQGTGGIALRPCFAGSGLFQSRRRRDTGGVVVGMSWEACAKSLMTNAVSPSTVPFCRLALAVWPMQLLPLAEFQLIRILTMRFAAEDLLSAVARHKLLQSVTARVAASGFKEQGCSSRC